MAEDSPSVTCPNCGTPDLEGPISEGFTCYKCGWSFEYGQLTTSKFGELWKKIHPIILKFYGLRKTPTENRT